MRSNLQSMAAYCLTIVLSIAAAPELAEAKSERFRAGGWDLAVEHDAFTLRMRCSLTSSRRTSIYQPGAIGFKVGQDALASWYRIDNGPPVRWQDRIPVLIAAGVALDGSGLDNPTGGWVWVPFTELGSATDVAIRANENGRIRHYRMTGFVSMLDAARRLGCGSDDAFRI